MSQLAIIDNNTLMCLGLKSILSDLLPQTTIRCFGSFAELEQEKQTDFVHYFVSSSIYFQQVEFFQKLGHKVVLLVQEKEQGTCFHLPALNAMLSESRIIQQIMRFRQIGGIHNSAREKEAFHGPIFESHSDTELHCDLSSREIEVLSLMVRGFINKEIADRLCISLTTVITHRRNIQEKTGIRSLSGLTVYAILKGYVRLEEI